MHCTIDHTAIILFTRSAPVEAACKRFSFKGFKANRNIAGCLIKKTSQLAKSSGLPFFIVDEKMQCGEGFAEKLSNATQQFFDKGYARLLIIGNDCLRLTTKHLSTAAHLLDTNESVAGPTSDGGLYLIGLKAGSFHKTIFEGLSWQTGNLLNEFCGLYSPAVLETLADVNDPFELLRELRNFTKGNIFLTEIISFLSGRTSLFAGKSPFKLQAVVHCKGLRAPPLY